MKSKARKVRFVLRQKAGATEMSTTTNRRPPTKVGTGKVPVRGRPTKKACKRSLFDHYLSEGRKRGMQRNHSTLAADIGCSSSSITIYKRHPAKFPCGVQYTRSIDGKPADGVGKCAAIARFSAAGVMSSLPMAAAFTSQSVGVPLSVFYSGF